jgi:dCMP deaminase
MRIGVAGLNGAGKTEVVRFLESRSFHGASLSDVIRQDLEREGLPTSRENMIERGRALRKSFGPSVLAERAVGRLPMGQHCVLDSIRHPAEVAALRAAGPFLLLWIDAPDAARFERVRRRGRAGDAATLDAFLELESRELASQEVEGQKLLEVRALADEFVANSGDLGELHGHLHALLLRVLAAAQRPSWDEYFMSIARVVASRSNCIKRMVGAVVVVDRRIISTGYNGTPRGVRNCNEGGCPRCAGVAESGTRLDECLCSHAEENAITQAAYHGVRVREGAIYTTHSPCLICTKIIINSGIREVAYSADFPHGAAALDLFHAAGVRVRKL